MANAPIFFLFLPVRQYEPRCYMDEALLKLHRPPAAISLSPGLDSRIENSAPMRAPLLIGVTGRPAGQVDPFWGSSNEAKHHHLADDAANNGRASVASLESQHGRCLSIKHVSCTKRCCCWSRVNAGYRYTVAYRVYRETRRNISGISVALFCCYQWLVVGHLSWYTLNNSSSKTLLLDVERTNCSIAGHRMLLFISRWASTHPNRARLTRDFLRASCTGNCRLFIHAISHAAIGRGSLFTETRPAAAAVPCSPIVPVHSLWPGWTVYRTSSNSWIHERWSFSSSSIVYRDGQLPIQRHCFERDPVSNNNDLRWSRYLFCI